MAWLGVLVRNRVGKIADSRTRSIHSEIVVSLTPPRY